MFADIFQDLRELYHCKATGAVTTRTSLLQGFPHDPKIHQYIYFDVRSNTTKDERSCNANSTINSLGYSPIPLQEYLQIIERIVTAPEAKGTKKPFIVSVTGPAEDIVKCHELISECSTRLSHRLLMEINLSCPNIPNKPPPAYSSLSLQEYLFAVQRAQVLKPSTSNVLVGIKTPPYTYHDQFKGLFDALTASTGGGLKCPVDFITSTNTLGNCLVMSESDEVIAPTGQPGSYVPAIANAQDTGLGGVGGAVIHSLALGNVKTIRTMLNQHPQLRHIEIIGVGGVNDCATYNRFKSIGASAVAIGTALGKEGIDVFQKILNEVETIARFANLGFNLGENNTGTERTKEHSVVPITNHQDIDGYSQALESVERGKQAMEHEKEAAAAEDSGIE